MYACMYAACITTRNNLYNFSYNYIKVDCLFNMGHVTSGWILISIIKIDCKTDLS